MHYYIIMTLYGLMSKPELCTNLPTHLPGSMALWWGLWGRQKGALNSKPAGGTETKGTSDTYILL